MLIKPKNNVKIILVSWITKTEFNECKYTNDIKKYLNDSEYSFIEWEIDTNKQRKVKIHLWIN